jgi:hypothetical protein
MQRTELIEINKIKNYYRLYFRAKIKSVLVVEKSLDSVESTRTVYKCMDLL